MLWVEGGLAGERRLFAELASVRPTEDRVERCADLDGALARLARGGVDSVVLAWPGDAEGGAAAVRRLRHEHPQLTVLGLMFPGAPALGRDLLAAGADDCLIAAEVDARMLSAALRHACERRRLAVELASSEARLALVRRGSNDGLWHWDLATDRVQLSLRWKQIVGCGGDEIGDRLVDWLDWVVDDDRGFVREALSSHVAQGDGVLALEHRMRHRDGGERWVLLRGALSRDPSGRAACMAGSLTDLSARKRAEQQSLHDALHDPLTGLPNRALFLDRLTLALSAARGAPEAAVALLFLDVDRLQAINDSLGHACGDRLLVEVAARLRRVVRPSDTVARLGGDEFALLATGLRDVAAAVHLAEKVQQEIALPFFEKEEEIQVEASLGIALPGNAETSAEGLLRDADLAMVRAKAGGRGRIEVYDHERHAAAVELLRMERELRRAVAMGDFVMHYQPIVSLDSGAIVGFEALTRWRHPERGLVAPAQFIAVAEETGLIVPLGWRVLEWACAQAEEWQRRFPADPPYFMSVNVSGKLFTQESAVPQVLRILEASRLAPESLRLEVTESVALDHGEPVMARLRALQTLGVQLSIDDFGTGYSSLSYLQRFRYDSLKIDRSFVRDLEVQDSRVIVETILALASHLGIGVVAEGVETGEQLARLRTLGCPLAQGYWFARPLDVPDAEALLATQAVW